MLRSTMTMLCLCLAGFLSAQNAVFKQLELYKAQGKRFTQAAPLTLMTHDLSGRTAQLEGLKEGALFRLDEEAVTALKQENHDYLQMTLPVDERHSITLQLVRHEILAEDFALFTSSEPGIPVNYSSGLHYKGIIEGRSDAVVALSIFDNEIMGLMATAEGNFVLGRIENDRENLHILYRDAALDKLPVFSCGTADEGPGYTEEELSATPEGRDMGDCVRVYIEIDDDIVTQKGGAVSATNYITGLFNQSIVLYANESVNMTLSEIFAWTTNSPYTGSSSGAMLTSFQNNSGSFNGNVGHLVSYQASGGIAVLDNLCSTNPDWRKCFSSIGTSYANVPTYSWSVMVITHEMGHVIGSKHTHACAWNGNNTAIDGCAGSTEGGCPLPGIPQGGGTIMSYCHLTNVGINFNLGFGPQPGNVIRNRVNAANNCLTSCGPPPPPPPPSYCSANGSNSSFEWIKKVVLGSINNQSGNNGGYFDYTALSTSLTAGSAYTIALTPGFSGSTYTENWRVWIDYNNDLDFSDAGEQVGQGAGNSVVNIAFTVPAGTSAGTKRMRVAMKYSGYPSSCGTFTYGEVEDYSVAVTTSGGASCTDGIQNQGETGVDCGGPCPACPTCNDGIQNQGETGIDCGGPCPACPTCNDGIQNQGETGVDCGGPCEPCEGSGGGTVIVASYFETGWDNWTDNGADATRVSSVHSWEGNYSIRLADNSGASSAMSSPSLNLSDATGVEMEFYFKAVGMEAGEDFLIRYKNTTGNNWVTIGQLVSGVQFNNNTFYVVNITVPNFTPTSFAKFRIQCDASDDTDQVYIDKVTITKLTGAALVQEMVTIKEIQEIPGQFADEARQDEEEIRTLQVYPNPAREMLNIQFDGEIQAMHLVSLEGIQIQVPEKAWEEKQLDIHHLAPGIYIVWVQSEDEWYPVRFSRM